MFERFTERARQVVVLAQDEARALRHNYIGTEHLLLGLLREEEGLAARVLGELGVTVHVKDQKTDKSVKYKIVGSSEANPTENKLSNESPVGKAIIGRKKGETVEVTAPRGSLKFKILEIKAA